MNAFRMSKAFGLANVAKNLICLCRSCPERKCMEDLCGLD